MMPKVSDSMGVILIAERAKNGYTVIVPEG